MGELHLDIVDRMKEFKVEANVGAPQVAYGKQYLDHRSNIFIKQSGGSVNLQKLLSVEPLEPGNGREVDNKIKVAQYLKSLFLE